MATSSPHTDPTRGACLLVPLDGSTLAEVSLSYASLLGRATNVEIELLTIKQGGDTRASIEEMQAYLDDRAAQLWTRSGVRAHGDVDQGIPHFAILEEAQSEDVSMIVISTHGHTGPGRWRIGSVADKVIRDAPCPVLVISPACPPDPERLKHIIVPLDGSELSETALPMAAALAASPGVRVELVQVIEEGSVSATAAEYLAEARQKLPPETRVESTVLYGRPAETLLDYLTATGPGLLVMSSHGGSGFFSYALGSVTDRMLDGPVPALIVRPGQLARIENLLPANEDAG